jgi:hypothetical protein
MGEQDGEEVFLSFESNPVFLGTAEEGKQPEGKEMEQPDDDLGPPDLKVM